MLYPWVSQLFTKGLVGWFEILLVIYQGYTMKQEAVQQLGYNSEADSTLDFLEPSALMHAAEQTDKSDVDLDFASIH